MGCFTYIDVVVYLRGARVAGTIRKTKQKGLIEYYTFQKYKFSGAYGENSRICGSTNCNLNFQYQSMKGGTGRNYFKLSDNNHLSCVVMTTKLMQDLWSEPHGGWWFLVPKCLADLLLVQTLYRV